MAMGLFGGSDDHEEASACSSEGEYEERLLANYGVHATMRGRIEDDDTAAYFEKHDIPEHLFPVNTPAPVKFENSRMEGRILFMHKPFDMEEPTPFDDHIKPKKRRWELRMQFRFKDVPNEPVWLGIETDETLLNLSTGWQWTMNAVLAVGKFLSEKRGNRMKYSFGQYNEEGNPESGLSERAALLWDVHAVDHLQQHLPGEELPDLATSEFKDMTFDEKKDIRFDNTENWYTCVYYSMYVDFAKWTVENLPGMKNFCCTNLVGEGKGMSICVYDMPPLEDSDEETRMDREIERPHLISERRELMLLEFNDPGVHYAESAPPSVDETQLEDFQSVGSGSEDQA